MLKEYDYALFRLLHHEVRQPWLDPIARFITNSGLAEWQIAMILPLVFFRGTRWLFYRLLAAVAIIGLMAPLIKRIVSRERPSNLYDSEPYEQIFYGSFPSGHTTSSFAMATVLYLALRHTRFRWAGYLGLAWATLVGISRIYTGVHWPTDVLAGALLGFAGGTAIHLIGESIRKRGESKSGIVNHVLDSADSGTGPASAQN